ncbi:MAG TPA: hypothetical protein VGC62_21145 [Pseudomonas sp.]|uniref:hypothetical protein n=1 Tax=Pseudomonas sp. TaxID=306 RepID=UPI002ED77492
MSDLLFEWVALISGFLMVLNFYVMIYVKYFILAAVEEQLSNCSIVNNAKRFWGGSGFVGRGHRLVMVNLALTATHQLSKKGMVDIDQVRRIPKSHRLWIVIPMNVSFVSMTICFLALALLGKLW